MSEAELALKSHEIDDKQLKLKRRMLGNIRFVGELYKQKLLTDVVIHSCIADLMGTADNWKPMSDEQDIECLCRLLATAGERLEAKSGQSEQGRVFNQYFDRLYTLSKDKSLNSRMRFGMEELLELRENRWQKRRAQEGPLKISEIHQ
ncbi:armadillo-type protein, partial [Ochromonadaceae sp. CCMP2298]